MEIIQTVPLAPDCEYFIDCALEHDEIDAGTHLVCSLYGPRTTIMQIIDDEFKLGPGTMMPRLKRCESLMRMADEIIADLPSDRRAAIGLAGLQHGRTLVQRTARFYAVASHEDAISGGCLEPFKRPGNRQEADRMWRYDLSKKQRRRLYGPNWIRRYVKLNNDTPRLRRTCARLLKRCWPLDIAEAKDASDGLLWALDAQRESYRVENDRRIRAMIARSQEKPQITAATKRRERRRRRVIARAASTAIAVLGHQAVSDFAQGRPVIVPGETLQLSIERSGSSAHLGHSGLGVTALDAAGNRLASMCIYYEKTPALDQLTALSLAMASGEEADIIQTANLSNVTDAGYAHPIIGQKVTRPKEPPADDFRTVIDGSSGEVMFLGRSTWATHEYRKSRDEAYWNATRSIWLEATGIAAMGRAWGVLDRALGALPDGSGW